MRFNFFNYYMKVKNDDNTLISYKGPVTESLIMDMCSDIREKLNTSPETTQKIFSIFIELTQNVLNYSADSNKRFNSNGEPIGLIVLNEAEDCYALTTGNLIGNKQLEKLKNKCEKINSLDRKDLRQLKREQRVKSFEEKEEEESAGIGLMRIVLTASNPLTVDAVKIDDKYSFFTISVNIKRA